MKFIALTLCLVLLTLLPGASNAWSHRPIPRGIVAQREGAPPGAVVDIVAAVERTVMGDPETREYITAQVWQCKDGQRSLFGYAVRAMAPAVTSPYKSFMDPDASCSVKNGTATFAGTVSYNQHLAVYAATVDLNSMSYSLDIKDANDGAVLLTRSLPFPITRTALTISNPLDL